MMSLLVASKNTIEGGVMGVAVDATGTALKGLLKGAGALVTGYVLTPVPRLLMPLPKLKSKHSRL